MGQPMNISPSATYYECGICGHHHPIEWDGDCREDNSRFTSGQLDNHHGAFNWTEVEMPE